MILISLKKTQHQAFNLEGKKWYKYKYTNVLKPQNCPLNVFV